LCLSETAHVGWRAYDGVAQEVTRALDIAHVEVFDRKRSARRAHLADPLTNFVDLMRKFERHDVHAIEIRLEASGERLKPRCKRWPGGVP
jgi:hypothetical protein